MGRRELLSVEELPLIGGSLCLDLVNTTGARASHAPRERLLTYGDLLVWSSRASILTAADANRLRLMAVDRPAEADEVLGRVRAMREDLYCLFRAIAEGAEAPGEPVTKLGALWRAERNRRELVARGRGFDLRLRVGEDELDPMLWPLIAAAVDLLTSERVARIKRCGECDWLFVDESKNGSRTWCKKQCGDRTRARRHYARIRRQRKIQEE